jgi:hypothetical protein
MMFSEFGCPTHNVAFMCSYGCEKVTKLINFDLLSCLCLHIKYGRIFMDISESKNEMKSINVKFSLFG